MNPCLRRKTQKLQQIYPLKWNPTKLSSRSPSGDSRNANTTTNVHFPKWNQVKSKQGSEILSKLVQVQAEQSSEQSSEMSQND